MAQRDDGGRRAAVKAASARLCLQRREPRTVPVQIAFEATLSERRRTMCPCMPRFNHCFAISTIHVVKAARVRRRPASVGNGGTSPCVRNTPSFGHWPSA